MMNASPARFQTTAAAPALLETAPGRHVPTRQEAPLAASWLRNAGSSEGALRPLSPAVVVKRQLLLRWWPADRVFSRHKLLRRCSTAAPAAALRRS